MAAKSSAVTKATTKLRREADELDQRRRGQIANQIEAIDRLLVNGSYDDEMAVLHEKLAEAQFQRDQALGES